MGRFVIVDAVRIGRQSLAPIRLFRIFRSFLSAVTSTPTRNYGHLVTKDAPAAPFFPSCSVRSGGGRGVPNDTLPPVAAHHPYS